MKLTLTEGDVKLSVEGDLYEVTEFADYYELIPDPPSPFVPQPVEFNTPDKAEDDSEWWNAWKDVDKQFTASYEDTLAKDLAEADAADAKVEEAARAAELLEALGLSNTDARVLFI